jgi:hypothetical protein
VLYLQTSHFHPVYVIVRSPKAGAKEPFTDLLDLSRTAGIGCVASEPRTNRHSAARFEPRGSALKETSFIEQVFGAFDAPHQIARLQRKLDLFGVGTAELNLPSSAVPSRRNRGPCCLNGANRNAQAAAISGFREVN